MDETCSDIWHRCCAVIVFKWMLRLNFQSQLHGKFELMACQLNAMILKRNQVSEKKVRFQFFCCFRSDFHVKCVENWNMLFISVQILTVFFFAFNLYRHRGPFVGAWNKKTNNRNIIEKKKQIWFFSRWFFEICYSLTWKIGSIQHHNTNFCFNLIHKTI